jgi:hypothetical protein
MKSGTKTYRPHHFNTFQTKKGKPHEFQDNTSSSIGEGAAVLF